MRILDFLLLKANPPLLQDTATWAASTGVATFDKAGTQYIDISDCDWVTFQTFGTYNLTVNFEVSMDGTNWVACPTQNVASVPLAENTSVSGAGQAVYHFETKGMRYFRFRISAYTSGTWQVILRGGVGAKGRPTLPVCAMQDGNWNITPLARTPSSPATVTTSTSSAQALATNSNRKAAYFKNMDAANSIALGLAAAAADNSGIVLKPGDSIKIGENGDVPLHTGAVNAKASAGTPILAVQEWT